MNAYEQEQQQIIERFRERSVLTGESWNASVFDFRFVENLPDKPENENIKRIHEEPGILIVLVCGWVFEIYYTSESFLCDYRAKREPLSKFYTFINVAEKKAAMEEKMKRTVALLGDTWLAEENLESELAAVRSRIEYLEWRFASPLLRVDDPQTREWGRELASLRYENARLSAIYILHAEKREYEDYVSFARKIRFAVSKNPRLEKQVREIDEICF